MLSIGEIKILRSCYHPLFFQPPGEKNTVALLVVARATSVKTKWSLAVHLFVPATLLTGKKYYVRGNFTCNFTNGIYLVGHTNCKCQYVGFGVFISQILKQGKIAVGLPGALILFAVIKLIFMVT